MEILSAILMIIGGIAFFSSVIFRTDKAPPVASLDPRHWKPVWSSAVRESFRSPGYLLMNGGLISLAIGVLLRWIFVRWPW
jgi:hypothetical protein